MEMFTFLGYLLIFLPLVGFFVLTRYIYRRTSTRKVPVTEKMLRPAGESVRQVLDDEFGKVFNCLIWMIVAPVLIAMLIINQQDIQDWSKVILFAIGVISVGLGLFHYLAAFRKASNYSLGFRGERFVGGLLETLREHGYRVYHDLPFENFNIDHALVGPGGVFAIETKTRRKKTSKNGANGKAAKVLFDGQALNFPQWRDSHGVKQARDNARHLSTHLSSATGEKVSVEPILVLPGWWVESTTNQPLLVLNPKQLLGNLPRRPKKLDPAQIQRIAYQLERMAEMEF